MRLKTKFKPAALMEEELAAVQRLEQRLVDARDEECGFVLVVYEPTEEPEDRLTHEEALERWSILSGLLQCLRLLAIKKKEKDWATTCGECIALVNELAADRVIYPSASEEARRKQSST